MADYSHLRSFSTDDDPPWQTTEMLQGLLSPAPAQSLVAPPPDVPPPTRPGQATPLTGNLAAPPTQATPKIAAPSAEERAAWATGHRDPSKNGSGSKIRHGLAAYLSHAINGATDGLYNALHAQLPFAGLAQAQLLKKAGTTADFKNNGALRNQSQSIGATETASGRMITQPSGNPAVNQALATDAMRNYRSGLEDALKNISGAKLAASRSAKDPERLADKIERQGQPAETVSDYGAAQISVDSPNAKNAVVAAVRRQFHVLREDDEFTHGDPEYGYRCYSMQVQMPNGVSEELQIIPKEVLKANPQEHRSYKEARDRELSGKDAEAIKARAREQNDAAMEKFNNRNRSLTPPALSKGMVVTLPDGSQGRISYLNPSMQIARVRTDEGKNITVRQRQLRVAVGKRPPSDSSLLNGLAKSLDAAIRTRRSK